MRDCCSGTNFLLLLAGAAAGTAIGMAFAPASGAETRRALMRKAGEARETLARSGHEYVERTRDLYARGCSLAEEAAVMMEDGRKLVENEG